MTFIDTLHIPAAACTGRDDLAEAYVDHQNERIASLDAFIDHQNDRIAALEAALVQVVTRFTLTARCHMGYAMANQEARDTLRNLGLAHRLPGNPTEAEEAVSS